MLANDFTRAYKGFFNSIIQTIQQKFEHLLQLEQGSHCIKTPQIIMGTANIGELFHDKWTKTLNQAVKDGEPADFSNSYDNQIYSIEKLLPRVRYLYYLMMDYNPISNRIRKLFLPDVLCENTDVNLFREDISVYSI